MPSIIQNTSVFITPEKFVAACSVWELHALIKILESKEIQDKLSGECICTSDLAKHRCPHFRANQCHRKEDISSYTNPK